MYMYAHVAWLEVLEDPGAFRAVMEDDERVKELLVALLMSAL